MKPRRILYAMTAVILLVFALVFAAMIHDGQATSFAHHCFSNGLLIEACKSRWAMDNKQTDGAPVTLFDIAPYSRSGTNWVCMSDGSVDIGKLGVDPVCTVHGRMTQLSKPRLWIQP